MCDNCNYNTQCKFITKCIENFSASNTVNYNSGSVPGAEKRRAVERQKLKDKQDADKSYHLLGAQKKRKTCLDQFLDHNWSSQKTNKCLENFSASTYRTNTSIWLVGSCGNTYN